MLLDLFSGVQMLNPFSPLLQGAARSALVAANGDVGLAVEFLSSS